MSSRKLLVLVVPLIWQALPLPCSAKESGRPPPDTIARACAGCHGTLGHGYDTIPRIKGLPEQEMLRLLRNFRDGKRPATVMDRIARGYSDEDFVALARFFAAR